MTLECQRFLCPLGVHPVGEEPAVVIVGIARPPFRQHAGKSQRGGQRGADIPLQQPV